MYLEHKNEYQILSCICIHSSTLAWKIPWTEEPGRLQSMGSLRVGHDWATSLHSLLNLGFPGGPLVKNPPAMQKTWVWSLGQEGPLEEERATHSSILAWEIPWTEKPGELQSMESQTVGSNWAHIHNNYHWATREGLEGSNCFSNGLHSSLLRSVCFAITPNLWSLWDC